MLDPIQYEFRFFQNTLADPEPEPKTSIFWLQLRLRPKVSAPAGSGSATLCKMVVEENIGVSFCFFWGGMGLGAHGNL
jgi:hypothetical protein